MILFLSLIGVQAAHAVTVNVTTIWGAWSGSKTYQPGQVVTFQGSSYITPLTTTLAPKAPNTPWLTLAAQGPQETTGATGPQGQIGPAGAPGVPTAPGAPGATGPAATFDSLKGTSCALPGGTAGSGGVAVFQLHNDVKTTIACALTEGTRYIDLGVVVVDKTTGLMWEKKTAAGSGGVLT